MARIDSHGLDSGTRSVAPGAMLRATCLALAAILALCACANEPVPATAWSKPGADRQGFLAVRAGCIETVRAQATAFYLAGNRSQGTGGAFGEFADDVLADFGWRATGDGMDRDGFQRCMNAQGWSQNPKGFAPPAGEEVATGH